MQRALVALALAALVAWSFYERWDVLSASPFPLGIDGYFYPIEVRSLLEHGSLAYPASPVTIWWMAPFAAATDPITGCKLAAALGGALVAVPAYFLGVRLGRARGAGLVCATVATLSAGSAYLSLEFVKQGIGITVALAALVAVLRAADAPTRGRLATAAAALAATLLTHKLAAALVAAIALPIAIREVRARLRGRRLLYAAAGFAALALSLLVLGVASPQRFASPSDLAHLASAFSPTARWDDAALARGSYVLAFDHEAWFAAVLAVGAGWISWRQQPSPARTAQLALVVLALAIAIPWLAVADPQGIGFRLRLAAFVPLAGCAAIIAGRFDPRGHIYACLAIAVAVAGVPRNRREGQVLAHPALVASALALTDHVPAGATLIVPERHVEFMVAWYTRAPVSARPEPIPYAQRVRVILPLSSANAGYSLEPALDTARADPSLEPPLDLHPRARDGFVVMTEATWDFVLAHLPPSSQRHFAAWPTI